MGSWLQLGGRGLPSVGGASAQWARLRSQGLGSPTLISGLSVSLAVPSQGLRKRSRLLLTTQDSVPRSCPSLRPRSRCLAQRNNANPPHTPVSVALASVCNFARARSRSLDRPERQVACLLCAPCVPSTVRPAHTRARPRLPSDWRSTSRCEDRGEHQLPSVRSVSLATAPNFTGSWQVRGPS